MGEKGMMENVDKEETNKDRPLEGKTQVNRKGTEVTGKRKVDGRKRKRRK